MRSLFSLILIGLSAAIGAGAAAPVTVSAASGASLVAPGSIVSIYGANLATSAASATSLPLPTTLGGASVAITDSAGAKSALSLFYAGPTQINAAIPAGVQPGAAVITVTTPSGSQTGVVQLAAVAPGLFSANASGQGVAAAQIVTATSGVQAVSPVFDCAPGTCVNLPIDVSSGNSALVLYGTGIRNRNALSDVTVQIGSQTLPVAYAGAASAYVGLDQVNVMLPASLAGAGTVNLTLSVAGTLSNVLTVTIGQGATASIACAGCTPQTNPPYTSPKVTTGNCAIASMTRVGSAALFPPKAWPYTANKQVWSVGYPDAATDVNQLMIADVAADGSLQNTKCLSCSNPNAPAQDRFKKFETIRKQGDWILLDVENPDGPVITQQSTQQLQVIRNNGYYTNLWVASVDGSKWYQLTHFTAPAGGNPGAVGLLNPTWSADGNTVFFPETYKAPDPANLQGYWRLYAASFVVDASGVPSLSNIRNISFPGDVFYEMQDVSPDGTQLLVQSNTADMNTYGVDIYAVNLAPGPDFGKYTDLTNSPYSWDEHSIYSPSGKKIAWISSLPFPNIIPQYGTLPWVTYRDYLHNEFFLMNSDGTGVQQLTRFNDPTAPEYSPQFGDALYGEWNLMGTQLLIHNGSLEIQVSGGNSAWLITFAGACGG